MHEIELRGRLDELEFVQLKAKLDYLSVGMINDKNSQFFDFKNGILKVSEHIQQQKIVLSLKIGDETDSNLEEYEVDFFHGQFLQIIELIVKLGYSKRELVNQKRIDYKIDDVNIAIKHTPDWGYHFEIEKVIDSHSHAYNVGKTRKYLIDFCKSLGITPMTKSELTNFLNSINKTNI